MAQAGARRQPPVAHRRRSADVSAGRGRPRQGLAAAAPDPRGRRRRRHRRPGVVGELQGHRPGRQRADQGHGQGQRARRLRPRLHAAQDAQPRLRVDPARGPGPRLGLGLPRLPDPGVPPARVRGQRQGRRRDQGDRRQRRRDRAGQLLRRRRPGRRRGELVPDRERDHVHAAQPRRLHVRQVGAVVGLGPAVVGRRRWRPGATELEPPGQDRRHRCPRPAPRLPRRQPAGADERQRQRVGHRRQPPGVERVDDAARPPGRALRRHARQAPVRRQGPGDRDRGDRRRRRRQGRHRQGDRRPGGAPRLEVRQGQVRRDRGGRPELRADVGRRRRDVLVPDPRGRSVPHHRRRHR